jgi:hypothetical protein
MAAVVVPSAGAGGAMGMSTRVGHGCRAREAHSSGATTVTVPLSDSHGDSDGSASLA